ncbi:MAG: putative hydrolase or acyltransferase of alpha/beta superfamily [Betaproteobacteria bacterium]|nr:putative hydrolase or acyltransferase of alpha/beta superfamily [Betaproteobacteria bacterium]
MQSESERAIFDLSWPQQFFIGHARNVPVMVMGAETDAFFTQGMIEATARVYGVAADIVPGIAHAMMLEENWQVVADRLIAWLQRHSE